MFDVFVEKFKEFMKSRLLPVSIVYILLFATLFYRLFQLQIVKGQEYEKDFETKTEKTRDIKSTRGNIYDTNGTLLAYNVLSYSVTLLDTGKIKDNAELNAMIFKLIQIIESQGGTIDVTFGLELDEEGNAQFLKEGNSLLRFKRDVYAVNKVSDLKEEQVNSTAEEVFEYLRANKKPDGPKFDISEEYTKEEAFKIMSIRYAMFVNRSTRYNPIVIATNVNEQTVAAVKEMSAEIPGVDIAEESSREYTEEYTYAMAHVLGYTGSISDEAWDTIKEEGEDSIYTRTDQVGKSGVESSFEEFLRGQKGYDTVILNQSNRIVDVVQGTDPTAGNDLYLSIDANLQKNVYDMLEKELAGILLDKIINATVAPEFKSASDIKIPITEVYYAILTNGILNMNELDDADASDLEKNIYSTFLQNQDTIYTSLNQILSYENTSPVNSLTKDNQDYINYIYKQLKSKKILAITSDIESKDSTVKEYVAGNISLSQLIRYAIGQEWIDRELFSNPDSFYNSEEIYNELITYTFEFLTKDSTFNKKIYKNLIYSQKITGKEICLLLFDQGVLEYDKEAIDSLNSNRMSPYTFVRSKIQSLDITPGELGLNPSSGSVVITDTETGKVKALVSYPGYDNNRLANKIDSDYYGILANSTASPMINRPTQQMTAPGSTYKMLSAIAGLEENKVTVSETIYDQGTYVNDIANVKANCWIAPRSHGAVDVSHALEVSCNYYFYELGYRLGLSAGKPFDTKLGLARMKKYAEMFGLGDTGTGIELIYGQSKISDNDSIRSAIGQGTNNYSPAQLSKYVTTLANRGISYNLSILDKVVNLQGEVIRSKESEVAQDLTSIKTSTWNAVQQGMQLVVNGPNSSIKSLFKDFPVTVAGKTGTAQESKVKPNHALFVSYAPYENPEISITTVIPNGYASANAAELTSNIYRYYFGDEAIREALLNRGVAEPLLGSSSTD